MRQIIDLRGRLPLAIQIAGSRVRARGHGSLADLAARLIDEPERLQELDEDDRTVGASSQMSINDLPPR